MKHALALLLALSLVLLSGCTVSLSAAGSPDSTSSESSSRSVTGSCSLSYAEDVTPLANEQDYLLHSFFARYYDAVGLLESRSYGEFFSDSQQAELAQAWTDLQVGIRSLQSLDYSLTDYQCELLVESVSEQEDGSLRLRVSESSVQHFACLPGVDSERFGTMHSFVLEPTADGWKIRSHSQFDALMSTLFHRYMDALPEDDWDPESFRNLDLTQEYIDAVPGYLEDFAEEMAVRAASSGSSSLTADQPYDREAAVAYADAWAELRNDQWEDYTTAGGNCQNYASQVLYAGGIPMDTQGEYLWKWYSDVVSNRPGASGRSSSWSGVNQFMEYAAGNLGGYGLAAEVDAPYFSGEPGDLIHMGADGAWRHTVVIVDTISGEDGQTADYLVDSNTANLRNYPVSLYGYPTALLVHIAGWNEG